MASGDRVTFGEGVVCDGRVASEKGCPLVKRQPMERGGFWWGGLW